jgi:hypothetical protein
MNNALGEDGGVPAKASRIHCTSADILFFLPWLTAVLLTSGGCDLASSDSETYFDHSGLPVTLLEATQLSDAPVIGQPGRLQVSGGFLWVEDLISDPGLHVLDAETGTLLHSLGTRGEGPGEFSTAPFGLAAPFDKSSGVWAWDRGLQRLTLFEPRPVTEYEPVTIRLDSDLPVQRVTFINPERIIGVSHSEEGRFSLFSSDGRRRRVVGGELLGPERAPQEERLKATNASINVCVWPGRGFAIVNFRVGRLEYYDTEARLVRLAEVPFPGDPAFEQSPNGGLRFLPVRSWYFDCTASHDHLFALFSGRLNSAFEGEARFSGEYLHVFDWKGELKSVFRLDRDIRAISVSPSEDQLFATSLVDGRIYRYKLPPIPGNPEHE